MKRVVDEPMRMMLLKTALRPSCVALTRIGTGAEQKADPVVQLT
jgi:hypothetical protein